MEVVAIDNLDLAILHAGGSGASVCQCKKAVIKTRKPVPMQVDGEPCMMKACTITISMEEGRAKVAKMLARNKNATCMYYNKKKHVLGGSVMMLCNSFADAIRDEEIENWAAKKIQNSFKQYKKSKEDNSRPASLEET